MRLDVLLSNVTKTYDGIDILKDWSFAFDKPATYVLMGPNGCGKSSLLRMLALIEEPDSGSVNYSSKGIVLPKDMGLRQRITLVLPKIGVFNTTVFKNVAYGLKIRGLTGSEVNQRVNKVLDLVRLLHKRNQNALTLSSGETQRMGIARALVIQPDVLLLDEPTAFVDIESRKIIEEIIDKMKFEDKTILITTHDSSQAKRLGNWILSIEDGKIQERSILPV